MKPPRCVIIAGPNGAGKTTFATDFLPRKRGIARFITADLIAAGLSPLAPALAQISAARLVLREMDRFAAAREDFADRGVQLDGSLVPRGQPGALIHDSAVAASRAQAMLARVDTICVHGDTPNAVAIARAVRGIIDAQAG